MKLSLKQFAQYGVITAFCVGLATAQQLQVATGASQFGSFGGGPFDIVNLGNMNVHFTIPVLHKAGRGMPFSFDLTYDSSVWKTTTSNGVTQWTPVPNFGWQTTAPFGHVNYSVTSTGCYYTPPPPYIGGPILAYTVYQYQNWTFVDRSGTVHPFTLNSPGYTSYWSGGTVANTDCSNVPTTYPSGSGTTTDGSGYTISITNVSTATVTSRSGVQAVQTTLTDANGNQITSNGSQYFDTLSASVPVLTVSGTAPSPTTFTYTAPSGGSASYTMNYVKYTVQTAFGFGADSSPIAEYGPLPNYLVDNIQLPDGTQYKFTYEAGPTGCVLQSGTSSCVTGRITSVTLPTGGTITYSYIGGPHGTHIYRDGSTAGLTRMLSPTALCGGTIPTGCWQYLRSQTSSGAPGPGSTWSTTVTDPVGNQSLINFVEDSTTTTSTTTATYNLYETQRQVYQGLISSSNCSSTTTANCLLSTIITCYVPYVSSCTTTPVSSPVHYKQATKQYPDSTGFTSTVAANYNSSGLPTTIYVWSATQNLQVTNITYASLGNNIVDRPAIVSVVDGSGNLLSQTTYAYDESSYPVQPSSGTPHHTSISGARGNATTINYYTTASNKLTKHVQYFDTGTMYKSWDVNGALTTFSYNTTAQSCGNSFPTTVTSPPTPNEPSGVSSTTVWNCTGGVATSTTDPNGNSVNTTYSDPYFWRPASAQDQLLNTTNFLYTPAGSSTPATVESRMPFNGTTSISEQLTTLDPFGRVSLSQQEQTPTSTKYDSSQMTYDALGRLYQSSMPYVGTVGQGTSTAAETTTSYDALGRVTLVVDGQASPAGYVQYVYNQNDVLQIRGPAPSGGSLIQKQTEYDALGRLISVCEITVGTTSWPSGSCGQQTALPSPPGSGYLTTYAYGTTTINSVLYTTMNVVQNAQAAAANQQTRQYVKDLLGRLIQETNPETGQGAPGVTKYIYDVDSSSVCTGTYNGDLVKKVDNRGNVTCYTYDSLHRISMITYPSGPDSSLTSARFFSYDAPYFGSTGTNLVGRLVAAGTCQTNISCAGNSVVLETFGYSVRGELTDVWETTPHSGGTYHSSVGFWANGAASSLALVSPANVLPSQSFGVEGKGRPSSVTSTQAQNSSVVTSTNYNLTAYTTTVTFGSGDSDVYTLSKTSGRLTQYKFNVGTTSDLGVLNWNKNGSLSTFRVTDTVPGTTDSQTCSYKHDDMARITLANCGNAIWRQAFSYDPFGNIDKDSTGFTGLTFNPSYSATTNQFTSLGLPSSVYDEDGRIKNDGVNQYTWDADGMLHTVNTSPGTTVTYDALGRMVEKQVGTTYTEIVYSPLGSKLAVMNGQTLQKGFIPLPAGSTAVYNSSGLAYYRHSDHLGSSRLSTTPSKTLYSSAAYAPFGEQYAQNGTIDNSFTGDDQDTVAQTTSNVPGGMYDTLMRKHMPVHGRWLSPDPAGLAAVDPSNPQTWNRYAYVMNNPMSLIDPFGEDCYSAGDGGATGDPDSVSCEANGGIWVDVPIVVNVDGGQAPQVPTDTVTLPDYIDPSVSQGQGPNGVDNGPMSIPGNCSVVVSCHPTETSKDYVHCGVTATANGIPTRYDGTPTEHPSGKAGKATIGSLLKVNVQPNTGTPPGDNVIFSNQVSCGVASCLGMSAFEINSHLVPYSFLSLSGFKWSPNTSNTAAQEMTNSCGLNVQYPSNAPGVRQ